MFSNLEIFRMLQKVTFWYNLIQKEAEGLKISTDLIIFRFFFNWFLAEMNKDAKQLYKKLRESTLNFTLRESTLNFPGRNFIYKTSSHLKLPEGYLSFNFL